jgi:hypothetical protein
MTTEKKQSVEFAIAERCANMFGKYFREPDQVESVYGGIEDKVLADCCHQIAGWIENYGLDKFEDGMDSERDRSQGRLYE